MQNQKNQPFKRREYNLEKMHPRKNTLRKHATLQDQKIQPCKTENATLQKENAAFKNKNATLQKQKQHLADSRNATLQK